MSRFAMDMLGGLAIVGMGVLLFFDPKALWRRWPFITLTERNSPPDDVDRTFGKIIGVCVILMGLFYTGGMIAEHLAE